MGSLSGVYLCVEQSQLEHTKWNAESTWTSGVNKKHYKKKRSALGRLLQVTLLEASGG